MSDSDESGVTYTEVSNPFEDLSDIGSPRVDDHEHLKLPGMLEDPYAPPLPDYVPGPEHANDEIVVEDQLYAEDASPTAQSPEYVLESDLEAYPEEDDDEDPEEDSVDYFAAGGDDDDDEEGSSKGDEDDDMDIEGYEEEEEEEHLAPTDSVVVALPAGDQAPSAEETDPFETDESAATPPSHHAYRMTSRISIPTPVPLLAWSDSEIIRLFAMSTLPSSPLSPSSSPLPQIPFPPLPLILSPPSPVLSPVPPLSPIHSLGYRAAMIRLQAEAASISHSSPLPPPFILSPTRSDAPLSGTPPPLPISAHTSSPPLQLPSASSREDRPENSWRSQADYGFVATIDREIRRDSEREVGYRITDSWDEIMETLQGAPINTDTKLGGYMREFKTRVRRDMDEIYSRLDDEEKARLSREAWVRSMDASDLARDEVMSLRTTVLGQMTEIRELHTTDRRIQIVTLEMLRADHRRSTKIRGLRTTDHTRQQQLIQTLTKKMAPKRTTRSKTDQETTNTTSVTNAKLQGMIDEGVTAALAAHGALRSTNGDDSHNSRTGVRRTERVTCECTYLDFMKCKPLNFKGTYGVVELTQRFEKIETVFRISNCCVENQIKFSTCTLLGSALMWWNSHDTTVGPDAAYVMTWVDMKKKKTDKYYPRSEMKKLKSELWNLREDKIERYVGGFPDMIHESVVASRPKMMQEAIEMANKLIDKRNNSWAESQDKNKRKVDDTFRSNQSHQQQQNKRQNTGMVYTAASGEKKQYGGSKPLCAKCIYHHDGQCALKCHKCNKVGHFTRDCRNMANTNNANNQRGTGLGQKPTCYECGVQGHFKREFPKLKNKNNHGNQGGRGNAPAKVYAVGRVGTNLDSNVVT
nr:hypothetical protein [Tanacetum cinerariifolium]